MTKKIFYRAAIMTLLAIAVIGSALATGSSQVPTSPNLKLQGLDGRVYDMNDLRGSVVLVSFGATWCSPCVAELRALGELLLEYRGKPVKFYWISIEGSAEVSNEGLKRYAKDRRVSFPVLRDTGKMVFSQFSPRVRLPMIVLLGKDGRVDAPIQFGMESRPDVYKANLRARLNKLLTPRYDSDR